MKLIVCLDDKNGMRFNKRRQSADCLLYPRILSGIHGSPLWMNEYSRKLFEGLEGDVRVAEDFLERAGQEEYCFVENVDPAPYLGSVQQITVYRWNRTYPADLRFPSLEGWRLVETADLAGNSHETITQEVYRK